MPPHPRTNAGFVGEFLASTNITVDFLIDEMVWRETAHAFAEYAKRRRKSGGSAAKRLLVDFLIGAHATLRADRLLTLDKSRYDRYFPTLKLMP